MRRLMLLLAAAAMFPATPAAHADLGDQLFKLLPDDGAEGDQFGWSVAISGTTAVVGAITADDNGTNSGSVYLFDTDSGQQIAKLLPNDGTGGDRFGISVAIDGTSAIVAACGDDDNGVDSGSAYVFDTLTGQQIAKLLPSDGAAEDCFGTSVAISGNIAIVGAFNDDDNGTDSGSAYLFDTTTGQQIAKLLPSDGAEADLFGRSVGISGTTAVVGAPGDDDNGLSSGSAYLFDATTGQQTAKLLPKDGAEGDRFGFVAISGTTTIIGAFADDDNGAGSGSAYLFDTTTGQQIAKLLAKDGAMADLFGLSVAISGSTAVVGAYRDDDNGTDSGSAYLFDTTTSQQIAKLVPNDGAEHDWLGWSVAISSTTVIAGVPFDADNGLVSGSAYLFDAPSASGCPEDSDGDGMVTICHIPPGNPDNAHTITVSANALPAHLAHGDHCGPCEEDDGLLSRTGGEARQDPCPADLDDSGDIGAVDLAELLGSWGSNSEHPADLNGDGEVGLPDLATLLSNWGPCQ